MLANPRKAGVAILSLTAITLFGAVQWASAKKQELVVLDCVTPANMHGKGLVAVYDLWNKKYPNTPVKRMYQPTDIPQKLISMMAAGKAPDIAFMDRFEVPTWAAKGLIANLDPYAKKSKLIKASTFWDAAWGEAHWNGHLYAIPHEMGTRALVLIDKPILQAGLDPNNPPKDINELELWAKKTTAFDSSGKLTRIGFAPTRGNWFYYGWLWQFGGNLLTPDGKSPAFNSKEGLQALEWMANFTNSVLGGFKTLSALESRLSGAYEVKGPFKTGQIAMEVEGDWMIFQMEAYPPKVAYTFAPVPAPPGKPSRTWVGGWSFVMPKGAKNPSLSWKFLEFLASDEAMQTFARVSGRIPAVKSAARSKEFLSLDPQLRKFVDLTNTAIHRPPTPISRRMWDVLNFEMMDYVKAGKKDPQQALDFAEKEVIKALKDFKIRL